MGFVSDDNTGPLEAVEDAEEKREERNARGEGRGIDRWWVLYSDEWATRNIIETRNGDRV